MLFYKGKKISSEEAHRLNAKERTHLTGRKPSQTDKTKKEKKEDDTRRRSRM